VVEVDEVPVSDLAADTAPTNPHLGVGGGTSDADLP